VSPTPKTPEIQAAGSADASEEEIQKLVEERQECRTNRDFNRADELRNKLRDMDVHFNIFDWRWDNNFSRDRRDRRDSRSRGGGGGGRKRSPSDSRGRGRGRGRDSDKKGDSKDLDEFIRFNKLEEDVAERLRLVSRDIQDRVIEQGFNVIDNARNPNGVVIQRIRKHEMSKGIGTGKGSVVTKAAGEKWKALSAETKKPFEENAAKLKDEYEAALHAFKEGGGEVTRRSKKDKKERRSKKAKKDPNAPKQPAGGAYGVYLNENREEIKKGLPADHKITDVSKAAAEQYKALSEAQKKVYEEKFLVKKEAYKSAMAEYKAAGGAGDAEEEKVASPPAKRQSRKRTADESSKKEPKAKPLKRGRVSKGAAPSDAVKIDQDVLEAAQKLGMESTLKNLAGRAEIAALNLAKYRKAQQELEEAEDRSKMAGNQLTLVRAASLGL